MRGDAWRPVVMNLSSVVSSIRRYPSLIPVVLFLDNLVVPLFHDPVVVVDPFTSLSLPVDRRQFMKTPGQPQTPKGGNDCTSGLQRSPRFVLGHRRPHILRESDAQHRRCVTVSAAGWGGADQTKIERVRWDERWVRHMIQHHHGTIDIPLIASLLAFLSRSLLSRILFLCILRIGR